jgi:hypothetical protein
MAQCLCFARRPQPTSPLVKLGAKQFVFFSDRVHNMSGYHGLSIDHSQKTDDLFFYNAYGIYDIYRNEGWVNVGIDQNTAALAVESIRT